MTEHIDDSAEYRGLSGVEVRLVLLPQGQFITVAQQSLRSPHH